MELGEGSLEDYLQEAFKKTKTKGLPTIDVLAIGIMLMDAVATVHNVARSLHLDIKPQNVLVAPSSRTSSGSLHSIMLTDFGLARRMSTRMTQRMNSTAKTSLVRNAPGGTPGYAPPEQGPGDAVADRRSDIYSIGATLLYCATMSPPYGKKAKTYDVAVNHVRSTPLHPRFCLLLHNFSFIATDTDVHNSLPAHVLHHAGDPTSCLGLENLGMGSY